MAQLQTRLTEFLSIKHPILSAPMAFASGGRLAAAVSASGALGLIGGGYGDRGWLAEQFEIAQPQDVGCGFITWALTKNPELLEYALQQKPRALMLSFGDISPFARKITDSGTTLIYQVQTLEDVRAGLDQGVDILVLQGSEAGGHGRDRALFPFIPEVSDLLAKENSKVLLVAAGGIADGRGLAAALALGADGVLMGSRYWASQEALVHKNFHLQALQSSGDNTVQTRTVDIVRGKAWPAHYPTRILMNGFVKEWQGREDQLAQNQEAECKRYEEARLQGDTTVAGTFVGECVGLIDEVLPAAQITESTINQAAEILRNAQSWLAAT